VSLDLLKQARPEDLIKFGLIPEFMGRLPVMAPFHELDVDDMVRILTEPSNALLKQYEYLLKLDDVALTFTEKALHEVARTAIERKAGARGLRTIMESTLLDVMFDIPSEKSCREVVVNDEAVRTGVPPLILYDKEDKQAEA
jgi:ATP-dependent Clp protease ATP-binding subunit ClpX